MNAEDLDDFLDEQGIAKVQIPESPLKLLSEANKWNTVAKREDAKAKTKEK